MTTSAAEPPRQIGSYEILAKIADGGVGTVYLARRRGPADFQRLVAIKRLHPQFADDMNFVTMFTDEARLAARIHHGNVVSIVELGADADGYYVVMDYVEGSSLANFHWHVTKSRSGGGKMPRAVALRIALDALSGLHAAHEIRGDDGELVNLVHRDVSPQNILIGIDGLARLGDFGIARASALRAFETRGPALKGKLEYMAPEQIDSKTVDRTTDLFAMGIVLWELLTGRRLFAAANQVTIIQRVCFDPIPSPRSVDPALSADLERICLHALERPRARRYPTAAAFAEELEKAARADAGIATQREVAECMVAVLGEAVLATTASLKAVGLGDAPKRVPDLGKNNQGNASTHQLPASDPMVKLPASAKRSGLGVALEHHPVVSGDPIDTEPYGEVPPPGAGTAIGPANAAVTIHYDAGLPLEVTAEVPSLLRAAQPAQPVQPTRPAQPAQQPASAGRASIPSSQPSPVSSPVPVSHGPQGRASLPPPRETTSRVGLIAGVLAAGLVIGGAVGAVGIARLGARRPPPSPSGHLPAALSAPASAAASATEEPAPSVTSLGEIEAADAGAD